MPVSPSFNGRPAAAHAGAGSGSSSAEGLPPAATVIVHGRASPITITVSWADATACRYLEQTWREGVARRPGACALSNEPVRIGDPVYRPIPVAPRPSNHSSMILSSVVDRLYAWEPGSIHASTTSESEAASQNFSSADTGLPCLSK
ncbi:DUF3331 domain-containing protein [Pararobbsia alpina]|uniref:DUF3331 domain-containing protein n=1 Tax=Pararobbsia alpina TaxID=621374 RepID=UPI0039A6F241